MTLDNIAQLDTNRTDKTPLDSVAPEYRYTYLALRDILDDRGETSGLPEGMRAHLQSAQTAHRLTVLYPFMGVDGTTSNHGLIPLMNSLQDKRLWRLGFSLKDHFIEEVDDVVCIRKLEKEDGLRLVRCVQELRARYAHIPTGVLSALELIQATAPEGNEHNTKEDLLKGDLDIKMSSFTNLTIDVFSAANLVTPNLVGMCKEMSHVGRISISSVDGEVRLWLGDTLLD